MNDLIKTYKENIGILELEQFDEIDFKEIPNYLSTITEARNTLQAINDMQPIFDTGLVMSPKIRFAVNTNSMFIKTTNNDGIYNINISITAILNKIQIPIYYINSISKLLHYLENKSLQENILMLLNVLDEYIEILNEGLELTKNYEDLDI